MTRFEVIEGYRRELRAMPFSRLDAGAQAALARSYRNSHHSNAIEGVHPTPEMEALFHMLVEERVPPETSDAFVDRYVRERIVPGATATAA